MTHTYICIYIYIVHISRLPFACSPPPSQTLSLCRSEAHIQQKWRRRRRKDFASNPMASYAVAIPRIKHEALSTSGTIIVAYSRSGRRRLCHRHKHVAVVWYTVDSTMHSPPPSSISAAPPSSSSSSSSMSHRSVTDTV